MDLKAYCPSKDTPEKLIFQELRSSHPQLTDEQLVSELNINKNKAGVLGLEIPHTQTFFSIPISVLMIREKCYVIEILHQKSENEEAQITSKVAARGSIPRYRAGKFSLKDFAKFSSAQKIEFSTKLAGLRSKNFKIFEIEYSRRNVTKFSKKRFQSLSGTTYPFNFYLNDELEFEESKDYSLPLPPQVLEMMNS